MLQVCPLLFGFQGTVAKTQLERIVPKRLHSFCGPRLWHPVCGLVIGWSGWPHSGDGRDRGGCGRADFFGGLRCFQLGCFSRPTLAPSLRPPRTQAFSLPTLSRGPERRGTNSRRVILDRTLPASGPERGTVHISKEGYFKFNLRGSGTEEQT